MGRARPEGMRTRSLHELFDPGGPRQIRSPSLRVWFSPIFSPFTKVPVEERASESRRPLGPQVTFAWTGSTLPSRIWKWQSWLEPSSMSFDDRRTMNDVPSSSPPVTTSVGWVWVWVNGSPGVPSPKRLEKQDFRAH